MKYTDEKLREILMENDYPSSVQEMIDSVISQLKNLCPEAQVMFDKWIESGKVDDFEIDGISPEFMRTNFSAKDIAIILTFDGLIKEPKRAALLKLPHIEHRA